MTEKKSKYNISIDDVEKAKKLKNEEKGSFKNKIYLINKRDRN